MTKKIRLALTVVALCVALPATALTLTGVQSRKPHAGIGDFNVDIDPAVPVTGTVSVEPRMAAPGHLVVFRFDAAISAAGSVSVFDVSGAAIGTASTTAAGSEVRVSLSGIPDNARVRIDLAGVNGVLNATAAMAFLTGDVNGSRDVGSADLSTVKSRAGQVTNSLNFRNDVNLSGSINSSDIATVKARNGQSAGLIPPPLVTLGAVAAAQVGVVTTLSATASIGGGGSIARVEFYDGASKLGEDTAAPFALAWTPPVESPASLRAKVITTGGAFAYSPIINVPVAAHAKADAARLLAQTTFGATAEEITRVAALSATAYLDEQFAQPQTLHLTTVRNDINYPTAPYAVMMPSIWKQYFESPDQLRQRVVNALSQIVVISLNNNTIGDQACGAAAYLDLLGTHAFGNFKDILKGVTLSPAMGEYLDMKGSAKADPVLNSIPSENYARELMQLFAIGTVMLNQDGSVQFDGNGKAINTYSEQTAQEVARALTGWHFAGQDQTKTWRWLYPDVPYPSDAASAAKACTAWSLPMEPWTAAFRSADNTRDITGGAHDSGAKTLLTYPGSTSHSQSVPAGQTPMQDVDAVIDNIFNHPNVGPFIGEQLIQRLVTSNPSGGYVSRVAAAFNNNGAGVRGDMKAVLRAILLDAEARAPRSNQPNSFGKLREPVMRFTHMHRAFGARMAGGYYSSIYDLGGSDSLGQSPMHAPSVFNFYHPDYSPSGPLAQAQLLGPEFEISNSASISGFMDFSKYGIVGGFNAGATDPNNWLKPVYDGYIALATNPAAMVDAMSVTLLSAGISAQFRNQLIDVATKLTDSNAATQATERFKTVLWLILNSPEYSIQK